MLVRIKWKKSEQGLLALLTSLTNGRARSEGFLLERSNRRPDCTEPTSSRTSEFPRIYCVICWGLNICACSVNAHAEQLRNRFVAHEGKKELTVYGSGNRYSADFGRMARQMTDLLDENVRAPTDIIELISHPGIE